MPINDNVAGPEISLPEDKTAIKARSLFEINALYMQAILACPNQLRNEKTCSECTLPLKADCDLYGNILNEMDEGDKK